MSTITGSSVMNTGLAGLVIGDGGAGPVAIRLFRPNPTRVFLAAPDYVRWLLAFRAMCLGAHLSIIAKDQRTWLTLADAVRTCGGTIDLLKAESNIPGQGRPYRPSLIVDEVGAITPQRRLGAWQALVSAASGETGKSVSEMRNSDLSVIAPLEGKTGENLRRAYALTPNQINSSATQVEGDVVLAALRRIMKVTMLPSPIEHRMLFTR